MSDDWNSQDFDEFDEDGGEGFDGDPTPLDRREYTAEELYLAELAENLGLDDINSLVIDVNNIEDATTIRGERFTSLTDALEYLVNLGLIGFSNVVYFEDDDLWGASVPDDSK